MRKVPVKPSPSKGKVSFCQEFLIKTISSFGFRCFLGWLFVFRSNGWVAQMCACACVSECLCVCVRVFVCEWVFVCVWVWVTDLCEGWLDLFYYSASNTKNQSDSIQVSFLAVENLIFVFHSLSLFLSLSHSLKHTHTLSLILTPLILNSSFSLTHSEDT